MRYDDGRMSLIRRLGLAVTVTVTGAAAIAAAAAAAAVGARTFDRSSRLDLYFLRF